MINLAELIINSKMRSSSLAAKIEIMMSHLVGSLYKNNSKCLMELKSFISKKQKCGRMK
jgi:hypothetical protein